MILINHIDGRISIRNTLAKAAFAGAAGYGGYKLTKRLSK